ncbi:MAG TPA: lysylphosphatidylglycerol synthase domain-containing protein [Streptosporangiaceae bacterium]|nr:lysylphosphatidylglycerol synthase domain-containing protein [Streptosporangiaceae bacterium]
MKIRSRAKRIFRPTFIVLALCFCGYALATRWDETSRALANMSWPVVGLSLVCAFAGMCALMMGLRAVLAGFGSELPLRGAARVWFIAQLGKYVPGKVWVLAAQVELAHQYKVPRLRMVSATLLNMAITMATGLAIAAVALPLTSPAATVDYWWLFLLAPVLLAALHPKIVTWALNLGLKIIHRPPLERPADLGATLRTVGWNLVGWALFGAHIWLLALDGGGTGKSLPLAAIGGYALAWTVGFLFFITPGGIGAREVALAITLAPALPAGAPGVVAIISRVVFTLVDLIGSALAFLAGGRVPVRARPAATATPTGDMVAETPGDGLSGSGQGLSSSSR